MDSNLQQAVVATKAGDYASAQQLLAAAIQSDPQNAEAWFLLAHLVDTAERQARYLEYTLFLKPDHAVAARHLLRLVRPDVAPPVIRDTDLPSSAASHPTPPPTLDSTFSAIPPARTDPVLNVADTAVTSTDSAAQSDPKVQTEANSKSSDPYWFRTAGSPKREAREPVVRPVASRPVSEAVAAPETVPDTPAATKQRSVNKWLLAILVILVALAFFFMSFLAYTYLF
jgi:Tetratricopeptide repeat